MTMTQKYQQYKAIKFKSRLSCVVCDKNSGQALIRLPQFPLTEIYVKEKVRQKLGFLDQEFHLCRHCGHGQIKNVIDPKTLYGGSYVTRTSTSSSAQAAVDIFLQFISKILQKRKIGTVFEIGCNDLYALNKLRNQAELLVGVDPILKGQEKQFSDKKIRIIGDFFENVDFKKLGLEMDIVFSSHTLEHIADPKKLIQKMLAYGTDKTVYFFQFPSLEVLVNDAHFDQIFHQHLNYFSLRSVLYLLEDLGGELIDFQINPYHWGALMIAFRKKTSQSKDRNLFNKRIRPITPKYLLGQYELFKRNMRLTADRIDAAANLPLYGYGAALMLPVLEYYLKRLSKLRYILDEDPAKTNYYYLNLPIQIKRPDQVSNLKDSAIIVTAINSLQAVRAILKRLIELNVEKIILPENLI